MATRNEIITLTNKFLELDKYPDYGPMGLQFTGSDEVKVIAAAVSVSTDVIEVAHQRGADMFMVHHGLFWNNESRELDERTGERIDLLRKYDMSLAGYHLALDAHPEIGNNALAAKALGLDPVESFGEIGWQGGYDSPMSIKDFRTLCYKTFNRIPYVYPFGGEVNKVAVIVGGAPQYLVEAHRNGCDTFVTGEVGEGTLYTAKELGMNFLGCGHHATEKAGIRELVGMIAHEFSLKSFFLDADNQV